MVTDPDQLSPEDREDLQRTIQFAMRMYDLARDGDLELIEWIDKGLSVNLQDPYGNSFILLAAYHGHLPLVTALVEHGADPNLVNGKGQTPLAGAVFKGSDDIVAALLSAGADPSAGTPSAIDTAKMFDKHYFD